MATSARKRAKPDYGKRLEARRKVLRKSLDDIVNETNGEIYKQLWYRVENGIKTPDTLNLEQITLFARALEWTPAEFAEATGLRLPKDSNVENFTGLPLPSVGNLENVTVRVLGNPATEGHTMGRYVLDEKGVNADNAFILYTTGQTLLCPGVKDFYRVPFRLFFNRVAQPKEGEATAYKVKDQDLYVIKMHHKVSPVHAVVVMNYDETNSLVLYPGDPELEYLGAVFAAHQIFS